MSNLTLARLFILFLGVGLIIFDVWRNRSVNGGRTLAQQALVGIAILNIAGVGYLVLRQFSFPLHLDLMEGTVLQHFERASNFEPIYPEPTPEYVPLAYNPGYYVLSIPFGWILGVNLYTLRFVALLGMVGSGAIIGMALWRHTRNQWWTLLAVGLFAAAYWTMDAYLNTAHSDSWFLFTALLGSYLISLNRSRAWNIGAVLILIAAFWFKQHGSWFAIGGVLYLTWQEIRNSTWRIGLMRASPYWLIALLLGPVTYVLLGPTLFGSEFHYFTLEVPGAWTELNPDTFLRFGSFVFRNYLILALISGLAVTWVLIRDRQATTIWHIQAIVAVVAGFMGALDRYSSNNVFIPMGALFVIVGTQALYTLGSRIKRVERYQFHTLALFVSLTLLLFDPSPFLVSSDADDVYDEFVNTLQDLDGTVFAPWQAQLPRDYVLYPSFHWVAVEDMIRGPGRDTRDHPTTQALLEPLLASSGDTYMLTNAPLENSPMFTFLLDDLVLVEDFGDQFIPIALPPKRFDHGYPRYLYRFDGELATNVDD